MAAGLETQTLYCDDNLGRLKELPDESVDVVYLDPPFFSNRVYEVIWGDEAEMRSFQDRWEGGMHHYIGWLRERVEELHRVLKRTGSLFLHCDHHAGHYIKVMVDEIFGYRQFMNELVWCYRGGGVPKTAFARKHDTIFFYSKNRQHVFNPQYTEYSEATRAATLRRGRRPNGTKIDVERGAHMPDWWTDINSLQTWSPERLGYPTQKPEALLERIIVSASHEGAIILDPFCGCGTTIAVAERLKRRWIGIDISPTAIEIMRRRLVKQTHGACIPSIIGTPTTVDDLRYLKPFEFQNWVINALNGTHSPRKVHDMGIDGYSFFTRDPIQVKQSERVGRNVVDNFETAMRRGGHETGYIVAFSFTRGAVEEVARARRDGLHIRLVKVAEILLLVRRPGSTHDNLGPQPGSVTELPLPAIRSQSELPSSRELLASAAEAG
jgi:DNA modification methylase